MAALGANAPIRGSKAPGNPLIDPDYILPDELADIRNEWDIVVAPEPIWIAF